jgi:hypothetical protein
MSMVSYTISVTVFVASCAISVSVCEAPVLDFLNNAPCTFGRTFCCMMPCARIPLSSLRLNRYV